MNECGRIGSELDFYLDRELPPERGAEVARHLESCAACSAELRAKTALRDRLRGALKGTVPAAGLEQRIRGGLAVSPAASWSRAMLAIAASVVVAAAVFAGYRYDRGRHSQDDYIAAVSRRVAAIMRVGLVDHIHCAVFRKFPGDPPAFGQLLNGLGPTYVDVVRVLHNRIPAGYRVTMAHKCSYKGRSFVHLTASDGAHLVSLVIARKGEGESFADPGTALVRSGIPIQRGEVDRFSIAGFETRDHLVYLVSDAGSADNTEMMAAMAPALRTVLVRIES
jgi:hypothetical protein